MSSSGCSLASLTSSSKLDDLVEDPFPDGRVWLHLCCMQSTQWVPILNRHCAEYIVYNINKYRYIYIYYITTVLYSCLYEYHRYTHGTTPYLFSFQLFMFQPMLATMGNQTYKDKSGSHQQTWKWTSSRVLSYYTGLLDPFGHLY